MSKQDDLIGIHPITPDSFGVWLQSNDYPHTDSKCHRELTEQVAYNRKNLIEQLSDDIIKYHYPDEIVNLLVKNYAKLGFIEYSDYLSKTLNTPTNLITKKGNLTEVILCEYVCSSIQKKLTHIYRFRYNPNVDQSMKGDDMLMIDYLDDTDELKVFLGEAKFRATPTKDSVYKVSESLTKDKQPLSYTLLTHILLKDPETIELGERLDDFVRDAIKSKGDITYVGLLLSDKRTSARVEKHLNNDNPNLVFVSLGIENPETLVVEAFDLAQKKLLTPRSL
jgi:HamA